MFDVLSRGFKNARLALAGKTELTEENIGPALREVRTSLIQADVSLDVTKAFLERIKEACLGTVVKLKTRGKQRREALQVSPQDHFVKACHDELVALMGPVDSSLDLSSKPAVIMMVGLQGSGKTTTSGKIAKKLVADGKKPMLVAADIYRPAAVDQLRVLGRKLGVPVFSIKGMDPVSLAKMAVVQARNVGRDVVIIDTAGRLAVDDKLMKEVEDIKAATQPGNVLFVVDAMIGQDAVRTAAEFDRRLDFTGFVLTKLDGDARGGAALSIKEVTGKPVKFLGRGEGLEALEEFRPEGLAGRILGMGDVVGLMQDFEKHVDQETATADAQKMLSGQFSYDDFVRQLKMVRKIGPIRDIMGKMPGFGAMLDQIPPEALDDAEFDRTLVVINSMTRQERRCPDLLTGDSSRMGRIAGGCGRPLDDVKDLPERFQMAKQMMGGLGSLLGNPRQLAALQKLMGSGGGGGFPGMGGGFPGMDGGLPGGLGGLLGMGDDAKPGKAGLSADEKIARRKRSKAARKARKRNRR